MKKFLNLLPKGNGFAVLPGELFDDGKALLISRIDEWAFFHQEGENSTLVYNEMLEVEVAIIETKSNVTESQMHELGEEIHAWYKQEGKQALREGVVSTFIETLGEENVNRALKGILSEIMNEALDGFIKDVLSDERVN